MVKNGLSLVWKRTSAWTALSCVGKFIPSGRKAGGPKLDPAMRIVPILRGLSTSDFKQDAIVVGPRGELYLPGMEVPECSNAPDLLEQLVSARACGIFP